MREHVGVGGIFDIGHGFGHCESNGACQAQAAAQVKERLAQWPGGRVELELEFG